MASLGVGTGMDAVSDEEGEDDEDDKYELLYTACSVGDADRVKELLEGGTDPNGCDWTGASPLHLACRFGRPECARLLLEHGADVDARNGQLQTPLHNACRRGDLECTRLLLKHGADVNASDSYGFTPLHLVCTYHCVAFVAGTRLLLAAGADASAKDRHGYTPLHLVCSHGCVEHTRLLLEAGADANTRNARNDTPEDFALRGAETVDGCFACVRLVRRAIVLRTERGVAVGAPLPLDWTESTHRLLLDEHRRLLARALGALLLVDARREGGGTLGREGALAFVAGLARLMGV